MADKQASQFCYVCDQQRLFQKPRINHVLHLILTLVTVGLWGIVWIILGISNSAKPLRCTACGSAMGQRPAVYPAQMTAQVTPTGEPAQPHQPQPPVNSSPATEPTDTRTSAPSELPAAAPGPPGE